MIALPRGCAQKPQQRVESRLVPAVGVLRKTGTLYPYDAEALAGRRLHHRPAFEAIHHLGAQLRQARHFGGDIVGLDVYVHATLVIHTLDLHDGLVGRGLQHTVVAAAARMVGIHGATERLAPEAGGPVQIGGPAVDQYGAEAWLVHISPLRQEKFIQLDSSLAAPSP